MKSIIISIHPVHVEKILSGEKVFEYRKNLPNDRIDYAVIYATSPVSRIVAVAEIEEIIPGSPNKIWETTRNASGISRTFYREYFKEKHKAYAIHFGKVYETLSHINPLDPEYNIHVPQSYSYLKDNDFIKIMKNAKEPNIKNRFLFIGGIHGSGKTTICQNIFSTFGYQSRSASDLIKQKGGEVTQNKKVSKIKSNQEILIEEIKKLKQSYARLAIDGHFCLINSEGLIQKIQYDVFKNISPSGICSISAPTKIIWSRLLDRDKNQFSISLLEEFQAAEIEYAREVTGKLNIPFLMINSTDKYSLNCQKFGSFLKEIGS